MVMSFAGKPLVLGQLASQVGAFLYLFLLQAFDPNEGCLKNSLLMQCLKLLKPRLLSTLLRPLSTESSALTTVPGHSSVLRVPSKCTRKIVK